VLFDSSWNPATDAQAAVRAFRMGQTKRVFVYRLVSFGTMEGHVYDRSVSKAQLAKQVVDKTSVTRMFTSKDLEEMFRLDLPEDPNADPEVNDSAKRAIKGDKVLNAILASPSAAWIHKVSRHDDATDKDDSEELTKEEEEQALTEDRNYDTYGTARPPPPPAERPPPGHGGHVTMQCILPPNFIPGSPYCQVQLQDGRIVNVQVPRGYGPGMTVSFTVQI